MKKLLSIILLFLTINAYSQEGDLTWHTDVNKAIEISIAEKKPLFMFFTGSDWCGWCIRLQKEVFTTPKFKKWAEENVILLELDYPRRTPQTEEIKKQNQELQQFFKVRGYPTLHMFTVGISDGKTQITALGKMGYLAGGPTPWIANANNYLINK